MNVAAVLGRSRERVYNGLGHQGQSAILDKEKNFKSICVIGVCGPSSTSASPSFKSLFLGRAMSEWVEDIAVSGAVCWGIYRQRQTRK